MKHAAVDINTYYNDSASMHVAVNGTLMRGLELEPNLINLGASFVREDLSERAYRLFSIDDVHPGMIRLPAPGLEGLEPVSVAVEIWSVPMSGIAMLLQKEPPGLSIGKVKLQDGMTEVLGVLAEPSLVRGKKDISDYPGNGKASFRDYIVKEGMRLIDEALTRPPAGVDHLDVLKTHRSLAELLYRNGQVAAAIATLNRVVKMLGLKDRLYLNIPL
jgi:hypothetical protein